MSTEDQEQRTGGVAHAFGNAVAWKWADEMPAYLKKGFLTMLYALRQHAAPSGEVRFNGGNRAPIKLSRLSRSAGCREQDGRRFVEAAVRAGIVDVVGERRRGVTPLFQLVVNPWPDWAAAEGFLRATSRGAGKRFPELEERAKSSTHGGTNGSEESGTAGGRDVRPTVARPGSGHGGSNGSGHHGSNKPCVIQAGYHDGAEVVPEPEVVEGSAGGQEALPILEETEPRDGGATTEPGEAFGRCEVCGHPLVREGKRCATHREAPAGRHRASPSRGRAIQAPLLMPVPDTPDVPSPALQGPSRVPDPFTPVRVCGCGREFRNRDRTGRCPDCIHAEQAEAARLAARRGFDYQEASNS